MRVEADILIVGGGINGCGIARDAAGRGLRVVLCEKDDLAQHTSSASTKLIHGGLRYLEHYEFRLVREALIEREVLLRAAPHIIWPLRFMLPHHKGLRPGWLIRIGLFLYDHLGGRKMLPPTKRVAFQGNAHGAILKDAFKFGFEYSDCWVEDSRLAVLNAMDAHERGGTILTRTKCVTLNRDGKIWRAILKKDDGEEIQVTARAVVNAAGPWVDDIIHRTDKSRKRSNLRLVKGSHLITRKLFEGEDSYILQNADGRIVFAIPYEREFTLVGTTDVGYSAADGDPVISKEETDYLKSVISEYFREPLTDKDIKASYSGVRPLYDDDAESASVVTRDYVFDLNADDGKAPILSIFGGKITTFRKLSEQAIDKLEPLLEPAHPGSWTRDQHLPGGDIPNADFNQLVTNSAKKWPWLPEDMRHRLLRAYGTRIDKVLHDCSSLPDLGRLFGGGLSEVEVNYLMEYEFATTADDILWRRSKLKLHMSEQELEEFNQWFQQKQNGDAKAPSAASLTMETEKEFHKAAV